MSPEEPTDGGQDGSPNDGELPADEARAITARLFLNPDWRDRIQVLEREALAGES